MQFRPIHYTSPSNCLRRFEFDVSCRNSTLPRWMKRWTSSLFASLYIYAPEDGQKRHRKEQLNGNAKSRIHHQLGTFLEYWGTFLGNMSWEWHFWMVLSLGAKGVCSNWNDPDRFAVILRTNNKKKELFRFLETLPDLISNKFKTPNGDGKALT